MILRPVRVSFHSDAANGETRLDNRLSFTDQTVFLMLRAIGGAEVVQCVWVYEHAINFDGLRRFHHNLGYGLLGRRIERSPLPFARHWWVSDREPSDIDFSQCARPRAELSDWVDERAQLSIDPEQGPGWHLGVLPLTDGSTAVSLVASHCLIDGLGIVRAIADAVSGNTRDLGLPLPCSRSRLRSLVRDARQAVQGAPEVVRALVAAAKMACRHWHHAAALATSRPVAVHSGHCDERVVVPAIAIHVDLDDWDARANALGGSSHHLVVGFAAKLGERMGCRRADGTVTVKLPYSDRTEDDTRANALTFVSINIDPTQVMTDLAATRTAIKQALGTLRGVAPEQLAPIIPLTPLVPFTPKPVFKRLADAAFTSADLAVTSSNLGDIDPLALRPDGSDAEYCFGRRLNQQVTRGDLERTHGELSLLSLRVGGKVCISVGAYQPDGENSKPDLRRLAAHTLAEFDLTGVID